MAGVKTLRKIQLGRETTAGTAVDATAIWRGLGTIQDGTVVTFPKEDVGILSGTDRAYIAHEHAELEMEDIEATFEQLPYIFEASIAAVNTGVEDTGGSGYVYTYPFPTTAANAINTYTLEGGDNEGAEQVPYGYVESFKLSGKGGEAIKVSAKWMGQSATPNPFSTAGISLPDVEEILFSKGVLYIDTAGGTIGTTTKSNTLLGMELNFPSGWSAIEAADGEIHFTGLKNVGPDPTLKITFEHDASSIAEKAAWKAKERRKVRINWSGEALTTAGTFTYKTLRLDCGGKWEKFDKLGEQNGNDIVTGTLKLRPDSSGDNFGSLTVVNELDALP
jgi:hypothetical protein